MDQTAIVQDSVPIKRTPVLVKVIAVVFFIFSIVSAVTFYFLFRLLTAFGDEQTSFPSLQIGLICFVMIMIMFFFSRGLYKGKNWARIVVTIIGIGSIVLAIKNLIMGGGFLGNTIAIVMNTLIVWYLSFDKKVKEAFKRS